MNINQICKLTLLSCFVGLVGCNGSDTKLNPPPPTPAPAPAPEPNPNLVRSDDFPGLTCEKIIVSSKDGIKLTTYVYLPDSTETAQYPAILTRTAYGRIGSLDCFSDAIDANIFAQSGYAFVIQESRGTYTSEGIFSPAFVEQDDAENVIDWITMQPWSNGDVGMRGASYLGITTWQAAITSPPALKAISVSVAPEDWHREAAYGSGVFQPNTALSWFELSFVADQVIRREQANNTAAEDIQAAVTARQGLGITTMYTDQVNRLPLTSIDLYDDIELGQAWELYLDNPYYNELWRSIDVGANINKVRVPALIHGAWYDLFSEGSFESFKSMTQSAGTEAARSETKLRISQYGHGANNGTPDFGVPTFGAIRDNALIATGQLDGYQPYDLAFFNFHLKGEENGFDQSPDVQLTVLIPPSAGQSGSSFQVESNQYPLADTEYTPYYLASDGDANNRDGSGALVLSKLTASGNIPFVGTVESPSAAADLFNYDPLNPVPTVGGNLLCCSPAVGIPGGPNSGAVEQKDVEVRDDVLVYTSSPLENDLAVIGPVSVKLFAKTDGTDTDFTAKLVDVRPDGSTHNLVDGIVRARLRAGSKSTPELIEPNRTYEYEINLGHVGTMLPAGHQIRLQISSSNFPKYARNLNTGKSNETTSDTRVAKQVILHDADHPSRLILPIATQVTMPQAKTAN